MTKKQQDTTRKTRNVVVKDLAVRDDAAANVNGGRDPATGLPTGKRMHKPYSVLIDPSSVTK